MVVVWRQQQRLRVLEFDLEGLRTAFLAHREKVIGAAVRQAPADRTRRCRSDRHPWRTRRCPISRRGSHRRCRRRLPPSREPPKPPGRGPRRRQPKPPRQRSRRGGPHRATPQAAAPPPRPARSDHRDRARHALGGLGRRPGAGAGRHFPRPLFDRGRHFRPRTAADPRRHPRASRWSAAASSSAAPASRCRSRASANAYVPGILTAAGAFTLFGAVYAAHGIYGFIGPTAAFMLLGADRHRHDCRIAGPWPGAGRRRRRSAPTSRRCWSRRRRPTNGRCSASRDRAGRRGLHRAAARLEAADGRRLRSAPALWTLLYVEHGPAGRPVGRRLHHAQ